MFTESEQNSRLYGKYAGVVVDNQPPEGGDKFQGEIKVKVSSILGEDREPVEVWAKPCFHPGFFFIPEVSDLVWVEFAAGNINDPIWTGVWYSQGKTPKTSDDQAPVTENKIIRTASGHVVELDDSGDQEKIALYHKNGAFINMENKQGKTVISITCDEMIIESDKVTVKGEMQVTEDTNIDKTLTVGTGPKTQIQNNEITGTV